MTKAKTLADTVSTGGPLATPGAVNLPGGAQGSVPYQSAAGVTALLAPGTSGQVLTSAGAGAPPTWSAPPASAGTVTAVASGALSDGTKVVVNSDGTVSAISATAAASFTKIAGPTENTSSNVSNNRYMFSCAYSATADRVLLTWAGSGGSNVYGCVGVLTGTTITFGAITTIYSGNIYTTYSGVQTVYSSVSDRFIVSFYRGSDGSFTQYLCLVNPSTNTVSTITSASPGNSGSYSFFSCCYDSVNNQVFSVRYNGSGWVVYTITTVTASSLSQGGQNYIDAGGTAGLVSCTYCTGLNQYAVVYRNSSGYPAVKIGNAYAGSAGFGNETVINSQATYTSSYSASAVAYSPADGKLFVNYTKSGDGYLYGKAGTISGTDVTFGSESYSAFIQNSYYPYYGVYDPDIQKVLVSNSYGAQTITFTGANSFYAADTLTSSSSFTQIAVGTGTGLVFSTGSTGSGYVNLEVFRGYTTNLTSSNFLGISNGAYTNGQTATIQTVGSTDDAQSGLTAGTKYYVSDFGTLSTATTQPYAGLAISATKLVIKG